ncbi:hypothetical protein GCM10010912_04800 [Paenibacillus albidus]|uniref:Uncharacterized protein n=1 Tax=Paenibacillus albidus TaxID=2041023 RepID=A0A917BZG0_9BACL|nr:hypothetical protein GCM10010912_04800 [Paenibacillus albidus]
MDHAEKQAAARGVLKVMLSSAAGRAEAQVFYERLDMTEIAVNCLRSICNQGDTG